MPRNCVARAVIKEGKALLYIPDPAQAIAPHGIEPAWLEVFYNPRMVFNRDLSVIALSVYRDHIAPVKDFYIAEPLTATGVRPIRYAIEVNGDLKLVAGDIDECAVSFARDNVRLNGLDEVVAVYHKDARELLYATRWILDRPPLVVDIDPFGSPAPYLDAAISMIGNKGLLAVTATDLAVLEGSKHRAALRKYGVSIRKTPESKEIGIRVLLGYIARIAASHDKAIYPLLSYYADHYIRLYVQILRGARRADRMLKESLGYAYHCPSERRTYLTRDPPSCTGHESPVQIGPLWTSQLNDASFIDKLIHEASAREYLNTQTRIMNLLNTIKCEAELEEYGLHLRVEQAASFARTSMPRIEKLLSTLEDAGHRACRSHYSPTSIRTSANYKEVIRFLLASS